MTLKNFTPVADNKVVDDGDPAADMNNTSDELAAMGGTWNILNANYAGGADATGTNDSTAAINAAVAAASAAAMPVLFPAGTFKVTSTLNWKLPNLVVQGAGPGNTIISMAGSSLNIPILELAGTTLDIGGFTLEYASQPASGNTSAAAIAIGDNTVGPLFGSRLHEINIFNVNTGMTIVSTTVGGCSSNTFENIEINGFTYSALNMQAASGTGGGDCTGNHWSNIYVHNNPLGSRTAAAGIAVHFKSFDENVFNQFNVEHGNHYLHDVLQFELCGNTIINSLHFEDLDMAGSGSPNIAFISQISGGSTIINGLTIRSPILTGSVANPVVRFNSAAGNVTVNGYNEVIGSGGISTAHPYCDFGSEAGCTMVVTSVAASLTTALEINGVATSSLCVGQPTVSGTYLCPPSVYAPGSQTLMATPTPTTVAAGSNGGEISAIASWSSPSAGVLDVASTTGWPTAGTINVAASGSTTAVVTYTGTSGGNSLTGCAYVSGSATGTVATGGAVDLVSLAPFDSGVICTSEFAAPASGNVMVTLHCLMQQSAGGDEVLLGLAATGTVTPVIGYTKNFQLSGTTTLDPVTVLFYVSGLTPGTSYQLDLLGAAQSGTTVTIYAQGLTATTIGNRGGPVIMTVEAV